MDIWWFAAIVVTLGIAMLVLHYREWRREQQDELAALAQYWDGHTGDEAPWSYEIGMELYREIARCEEIIWKYRNRLAEKWPTPNQGDCLRFAFTEAAEALDAHLRINGMYVRNNNKDLSVEDELADCAMMLLTAIDGTWDQMPVVQPESSLDKICASVGIILDIGPDRILVSSVLMSIANWPEMNLAERVTARLQRIERKINVC